MPAPLQAVVFDLDGLMFNTEDLYQQVGTEVLKRRGKEFSAELIAQMMGRQSHKALQLMIDWHQLDDTHEELAAESMEIMFRLLPNQLQPMPGLLDLLNSLEAAEIPKGIATSSTRAFVTRVLDQFALAARFSFVLTAEDITHGKPAPDVYLLSAEKHGVKPEQVMVLEDSQIGCRAAVAAGTHTVAVPEGQNEQQVFEGVKLVATSLADAQIYEALGIRLVS
ncbi:MAG: HAD-IA family hydrolase [Planctomycetes bacterium]|nr:HAD-IA family hydrolase [Planctomycetota bacterium]